MICRLSLQLVLHMRGLQQGLSELALTLVDWWEDVLLPFSGGCRLSGRRLGLCGSLHSPMLQQQCRTLSGM